MAAGTTREVTGHALLTATASLVCLVLAESLHLEQTALPVWTTCSVMAQYTYTSTRETSAAPRAAPSSRRLRAVINHVEATPTNPHLP